MYRLLVNFCLLAGLATAQYENSKNYSPRIIGGKPMKISQRPFIIALFHKRYGFLCGASIISEDWAVTAKHCIVSANPKQFYVRAGSRNRHNGRIHYIKKIHNHNDTYYNDGEDIITIWDDISLFQVHPKFRFSKYIRPALLANEDSTPPDELVVSGWGVTESGSTSNNLLSVKVKHVPFDECIKCGQIYKLFVREDKHLCYGESGKDSCNGDSGGPLANGRKIYGIVSFGHNCGLHPGVYTKISNYRDWIRQISKV